MANASKPDTSVDALYDDIQRMNPKITDLQTQVARLHRFARVEEIEDAVGKRESDAAVMRSVAGLAHAVEALALVQGPRADLDADFYEKSKAIRYREVRQHVAHKLWLSTLAQEITYLCPCGKHLGIKLLTSDGKIIEENLCPVNWWVALSQVAYEQGTLKAFCKATPMAAFLLEYSLEKQGKSRT